jgi:hypothetical protein
MRTFALLGFVVAAQFLVAGCSSSGGKGQGTPDLASGVGGVGESPDLAHAIDPPPADDMAAPVETQEDMATAPPGDMALPPLVPGADTTVTVFNQTLFSWDGMADHRENKVTASLPADGVYKTITLHIQLTCPAGGCDPWDRLANIGVIAANGNTIEIARYATPYGVGGAWDVDVTDLRPILAGSVQFKGFVDTWVGSGKGWLLTATLKYVGGIPSNVPVAVLPTGWGNLDIGDPAHPPAPSANVTLPAGASRAALRLFVSGHGQGNANNCAEFCSLGHAVLLGGAQVEKKPLWRDDCKNNPINNQAGTWQYARAGWCPGADVKPWTVSLGQHAAGQSFKVDYAIDSYVNTCSPASCTPSTCVFKTSCDYDNGNHTSPYYAFSGLVIAYR